MSKTTPPWSAFVLGALLAAAGAAQSAADLAALWRDPVFQKQFVAGYGVDAQVEPRVTADEVAILERIRPLMADKLPEAEAALHDEITPESSALLDFTLGSIRFQLDETDAALADYQRAVAKFPSFRRAWRNLGLVHVRAGRFDAAIHAFTRMIELGGGDAYAYGLLGYAYASRQDQEAAEAAYRNALLLQPDNIEWRLGLTRCVFRQQKFADAAALLDSLLARHPEKGEFWLLQAQAYLGLKAPLQAAADLEILDSLGKSTTDSLYTLGDVYIDQGLPELAAGACARALALAPTEPPARPLRAAELLAARGAVAAARQLALAVAHACGDRMGAADTKRLHKLEARLALADGDTSDAAVQVLDEVVRDDPLDGEALLLLGQLHARRREPDRAIFCYERAESLEAFEVEARIRHAQELVRMDRPAEAVPLLRRAQELRPRDDVARYLEQVERVARARR